MNPVLTDPDVLAYAAATIAQMPEMLSQDGTLSVIQKTVEKVNHRPAVWQQTVCNSVNSVEV